MEYDGKNMYNFFQFFLNFVNSCTRYVHGEPMCTGYVLTCFLVSMNNQFFLEKHSINADLHTRMNTHIYEHIYAHSILMSTSERLSRLDLEIYEVGYQERLTVNENITYH
jgi:hypothetical protein